MNVPLDHERQITFFPTNGHNHDGENSTPVELQPGQVGLDHLDPSLLDYLRNIEGDGGNDLDDQLVPIPDLEIETDAIGPGGQLTGSVDWTGIALIRFMRIVMNAETECTITFYHSASYADEDREFRARRCGNKFLWEGPWVHWDEDETNKVHYRIQNTGTASARFNITLKAGTLVANAYANFVSGLRKTGSTIEPFIGSVFLQEGNGIRITPNEENNTFLFEAVAPETVTLERYALIMRMPASYTGSTTTSGSLNASGNFHSTTNVNFGTGPQWIRLDYGRIINAGRIQVVPYHDGRQWYDCKLEVSPDNLNWFTLMSQQTEPLMVGQVGVIIECPTGFPVRYVRWHSNGSTSNSTNHLVAAVVYEISDKVGST